jgi:hypothetical protein
MKAVDQMFERAGVTLACTSYRWRCWVNSYHKDPFWATASRETTIESRCEWQLLSGQY